METKNNLGKYILTGIVGLVLLASFDQWTKQMAVKYLAGQEDIVLIPGVLSLHYLENSGAAFGIMQDHLWIFVCTAILFLFIAAIVYWKLPRIKRYLPLHSIVICITAGALGNVIDRIRLRYVVDFIYFSLIDFPVFNVADIYVTVSSIILVLLVVFYYKEDDFYFLEKQKKQEH